MSLPGYYIPNASNVALGPRQYTEESLMGFETLSNVFISISNKRFAFKPQHIFQTGTKRGLVEI